MRSLVLFVLILGAVISLRIFEGFSSHYYSVGNDSMLPTLRKGEVVLIDMGAYSDNLPQAGEIVAIRYHGRKNFEIARIVGVPGDRVTFDKGKLFLNGISTQRSLMRTTPEMLDEFQEEIGPHKYLAWYGRTLQRIDAVPISLAKGEYFASGDNRDHATDSRIRGPVHMDDILGRAISIHESSDVNRRGLDLH